MPSSVVRVRVERHMRPEVLYVTARLPDGAAREAALRDLADMAEDWEWRTTPSATALVAGSARDGDAVDYDLSGEEDEEE